jgi:nicotinamidase-related amidase
MDSVNANPKRALLVIDVQNEYFMGKLPITYPSGSLTNLLCAMDAARAHGLPVVAVQHASPQSDAAVFRKGSKEWELHPEMAARRRDVLIHKSLPGSFYRHRTRDMAARARGGDGCHCWLHDPDVL